MSILSFFEKNGNDDEIWLKKIMEEYSRLVFFIVKRYIKDEYYREEVVADVFYKILKLRKTLEDKNENEKAAYISTITKNSSLDLIRKQRKEAAIYYFEDLNGKNILEPANIVNILEEIGEIKIGSYIDAYIDKLEEQQQHLIWLYYHEELTYSEIASLLGIRTEAAKKRVQRAVIQLQKIMKEGGDFNKYV